MESLCNFQTLQMKRRLCHDFLPFASGARDAMPQAHKDKLPIKAEDLDAAEQRFVEDWVDLMCALSAGCMVFGFCVEFNALMC